MRGFGFGAAFLCALTGCGSADETPGRIASEGGSDAHAEADAHADADAGSDATPAPDASDAAVGCPVPTGSELLTFTLTHAAYPGSGHPDVAVHVPAGFDPCTRPSLVAFFHGFDNCVTNAIGAVDTECTPGGPARTALHLAEQLDATKLNAILVAVELAYDEATGDPGQLADAGEFKAMLDELFTQHLTPLLGASLSLDGLDRVVLASHSGGYWAVANVLDVGGVDVDEVELFDSLYGEYPSYSAFIENDITRFGPQASAPLRFSDVFTTSGGTLALSEQLEAEVESALNQAGLASALFYQDQTAPTPTPADYAHPLFFKHSELSHYGVPQYYFERLLGASGIAPISNP